MESAVTTQCINDALPKELITAILVFAGPDHWLKVALVCKKWHEILTAPYTKTLCDKVHNCVVRAKLGAKTLAYINLYGGHIHSSVIDGKQAPALVAVQDYNTPRGQILDLCVAYYKWGRLHRDDDDPTLVSIRIKNDNVAGLSVSWLRNGVYVDRLNGNSIATLSKSNITPWASGIAIVDNHIRFMLANRHTTDNMNVSLPAISSFENIAALAKIVKNSRVVIERLLTKYGNDNLRTITPDEALRLTPLCDPEYDWLCYRFH